MKRALALILSLCFLVVSGPLQSSVAQNAKREVDAAKARKEQTIRVLNRLRVAEKRDARPVRAQKSLDSRLSTGVFAGGSIAGTLFGLSADDVVTASVTAWVADSTSGTMVSYSSTLEPDGTYIISDVEPGSYYVLAQADGYLPLFFENATDIDAASVVTVYEGSVTDGIDFRMVKTAQGMASISGTVTGDAGGLPVAAAYVSVFSIDNPYLYGSVMTGADGSYRIEGLPAGTYFATVWADGFMSEYFDDAATFEDATPIVVAEADQITGIDFGLSRGGIISGIVSDDEGVPIEGVYVQAFTEFGSVIVPGAPGDSSVVVFGFGSAITDDSGRYEVSGLPSGEYLVTAQLWSQWYSVVEWYDGVKTPEQATPVTVVFGAETTGIDFRLSIPSDFGDLFGRVVDLDGNPLEGVAIQAQSPFDIALGRVDAWAFAYTDANGEYRMSGIPAGSYLVSAWASVGWQYVQRYWPDAVSPEGAQPVVVNENPSAPQPVDFVLPVSQGTASISGRVLRDTGESLPNASVQITWADDQSGTRPDGLWAWASTDADGRFQVDNLPAGEYVAQAQYWEFLAYGHQWYDHADSRAEATPISVSDGEHRENVDFELTPRPYYGSISGTVRDDLRGLPVRRAYVEVMPVGYDYRLSPIAYWSNYAVTDEMGNFKIDWLFEGEYVVATYGDGAFEYYDDVSVAELATNVKVVGGETTAIDVGLTPRDEGTGMISGEVTREWDGVAPEIAVVTARPAAATPSEQVFNAVTDALGRYELVGLPAGEFYVFSFAPGHIGEYYENVFDPGEATLVRVEENQATTGIDFALIPVFYLDANEGDLAGIQRGATIFGSVTDRDGNLLRDATVYLLNESGQPVSFARTNSEGMYEMPSVPAGRYYLRASHFDFTSRYYDGGSTLESGTVVEVGGGRTEINFSLNPVTPVGTENVDALPESVELYGNYPNPFNPETQISFGLPVEMKVRLRIFNVLGQEVRLLDGGRGTAGTNTIVWDGRGPSGQALPSGLYVYVLEADGRPVDRSVMTLLR